MDYYEEIIREWKQKKITTVEDYSTVLSNFCIVFAYHSGVIENPEITYHNTREIFENGKVINFTGNLRTVFEMENQKKCYGFILEALSQKRPITPELMKEIHYSLTQGTYDEVRWNKGERPGEFKKHDYVIGKTGQGAPPEEVEQELKELCNEIQDVPDKGDNILKAAAYFHCKFENIHAFADGNGRVGRTMMNYFFMLNNYPPIIVFQETKEKYYEALDAFDASGEIKDLVSYLKDSLEKTWEKKSKPTTKLELD